MGQESVDRGPLWQRKGQKRRTGVKTPGQVVRPRMSMCEQPGMGQELEEAGRTEWAVGTESELDPELQQALSPGLPLPLPTSHAESLRSRWTYRASGGGHIVGEGGPTMPRGSPG